MGSTPAGPTKFKAPDCEVRRFFIGIPISSEGLTYVFCEQAKKARFGEVYKISRTPSRYSPSTVWMFGARAVGAAYTATGHGACD
ncbi:MAG: hypothetical protein B7Y42_03700 [Polaromonas sp. 28-63-22]|nr:MAG: hypothetical protein B7Y42_03700 [Polaromonas sp. 28-63-22]